MNTSRSDGFTLIEVLVVVAIIGILASIVLGALGSARSRARDAHRVAVLTQIGKAVNLYDTGSSGGYGFYTTGTTACTAHSLLSSCTTFVNSVSNALANVSDPSGATTPCPAQTPGATPGTACAYSISRENGGVSVNGGASVGIPNSQNWEVCAMLENGNSRYAGAGQYTYGSGTSFGEVHVGSDTSGAVVAGCN